MKNKILLAVSLTAFAGHAAAQTACDVDKNLPYKRMQLPGSPSWFISANPVTGDVGVIGAGGSGNYLLDMNRLGPNGQPYRIKIPGGVDPVFTPDGKYLTNPGVAWYSAKPMKTNLDARNDGGSFPQVYNGGSFGAGSAYQSIGVLSANSQKDTYMYIADSRSGSTNSALEYQVIEANASGNPNMQTVKKGNLCPGIEGHTPMISNDGKYLSILNTKTNSTQIYKVDTSVSNGDMPCKMVVDLGVPTGKVSFDFGSDKRKVAFHVDRFNTDLAWFQTMTGDKSKDTFVLDLDVVDGDSRNEKWKVTGMQRLNVADQLGSGSYYPRFTKDGEVATISVDKSGGSTKYYIDKFKLENGKTVKNPDMSLLTTDYSANSCSPDVMKDAFLLYSLAYLYKQACETGLNGMNDRLEDALLLAPSLNHDACKKLVNQFWNENTKNTIANLKVVPGAAGSSNELSAVGAGSKKSFSESLGSNVLNSITKNDLLAACPAPHTAGHHDTQVVTATQADDTPEKAFLRNCGGCHNANHADGGYNFQNSDGSPNRSDNAFNLNSGTAQKSVLAIWDNDLPANKRMPRAAGNGGQARMSVADKEKTTKYLLQFMSPTERQSFEGIDDTLDEIIHSMQ